MMRSVELELVKADDDEHEVYGRIVPFGVTVHVREPHPTTGELEEYDEEFEPGCTERIRNFAAKRGGQPGWIQLTHDHLPPNLESRFGYCTDLHERDDGAYARFRLDHDPRRIDKILSMLRTSHRYFSIEFIDHPRPLTGTHRRRRQVTIGTVTATPIPVYEGAAVLAMRADDPLTLDIGTPRLDEVRAMLEAERARYATTA